MNPNDALARQHSLRDGQAARARVRSGEPLDREAIKRTQIEDGVPPRFANLTKGDLADSSLFYVVADNAVDDMMRPNEHNDGLLLYTSAINDAGRIAGAIYTGAVVRYRAAKWINFSEFVTATTDKISVDSNKEWDVGDLATWHTELESTRFCYDLVVIHDLRSQLMTPYIGIELFKLVAARAVRGLYTVITAPLGQGDALWANAEALHSLVTEQFALIKEK